MSIIGHRTRGIFNRDHIVGPADMQASSRWLAEAAGARFRARSAGGA